MAGKAGQFYRKGKFVVTWEFCLTQKSLSYVAAASLANTQTLVKEGPCQQTLVLRRAPLAQNPSSASTSSSLLSTTTISSKSSLLQTRGRALNAEKHCSGTAGVFAMNSPVSKEIHFKAAAT